MRAYCGPQTGSDQQFANGHRSRTPHRAEAAGAFSIPYRPFRATYWAGLRPII